MGNPAGPQWSWFNWGPPDGFPWASTAVPWGPWVPREPWGTLRYPRGLGSTLASPGWVPLRREFWLGFPWERVMAGWFKMVPDLPLGMALSLRPA